MARTGFRPRAIAKPQRIHEIAARHGASDVRVFGSAARGDAHPGSDIDFLVHLEPDRTLLDLGGLQYELQELLGCDVDVVTERGLSKDLAERVRREARAL